MASKNHTKGFTLIEVLMSVTIMSVMAGVMILSHHSADQTPKREAEKVAAYITRLTQKSDRIKVGFNASIDGGNILNVSWDKGTNNTEPPFEISAGLNVKWDDNHLDKKLIYDYKNYPNGAKISALDAKLSTNNTKHRYIKITAANSSTYYVLITSSDIN